MRRVSSRQRLFFWDAFDATTGLDYSDDDFSDYFDAEEVDAFASFDSLDSNRRKRGRRAHPISRKVVAPPAAPRAVPFHDLVEDVQLNVFSFLNCEDLRAIMSVNRKYRALISSKEAYAVVWENICRSKWPVLQRPSGPNQSLVDSHQLPAAVNAFSDQVNIPLLLSMTPTAMPTKIDVALLEYFQRRRRTARTRLFRGTARSQPSHPFHISKEEGTGIPVVRYRGPIGDGDRCLRANHPFPRPQRKKMSKALQLMEGSQTPSLLELLCRGARAVAETGMTRWRPFVAPYLENDGNWQVSPRMIAYYEVDIHTKAAPSDDDNVEFEDDIPGVPTTPSVSRAECVAVGLAKKGFHVQSRMPGWDGLSFGYHGDDGGIFHSSGGMVERFGPTFGEGDIVGCGIDYVARGIFYTLNGKFLGYGWKDIPAKFLESDLYPVVGIDTNAPVSVNFGTSKPFKFDLTEFHQKHASLISERYMFKEAAPSVKR